MKNWTWTLGVVIGAAMGVACSEDESEPLNDEVAMVCEDFCQTAIDCGEELLDDRQGCLEECYGKADECDDVGELDSGLEELRECSESCDFFQACSINVDLQCFL